MESFVLYYKPRWLSLWSKAAFSAFSFLSLATMKDTKGTFSSRMSIDMDCFTANSSQYIICRELKAVMLLSNKIHPTQIKLFNSKMVLEPCLCDRMLRPAATGKGTYYGPAQLVCQGS